jgi:beta-glucosidase-like glycosyl hydrolase
MPERPAYRDASLSPDRRAEDLLARMDRDEKIGQLCSVWLTLDPASGDFAPFQGMFMRTPVDQRETLRHGIGQITRPLGSRPVAPRDGARALNAFQKYLIETTRLGIPAIAHEESLSGFMAQGATQFPSPLNYGATWDPDLIRRVADAIRRQMRAVGTHQALAPVADVARDARWGRVEETVGEDPFLVGTIVSAYVAGLQGEDLRDGIAATLKHFCGYSGSEGGRNFAPLHAGPRELADVFLLPFEMAVKGAGAKSVMNAYQEIDGVPCAASRWLLTETLRERWGFDGIVVADYFAVRMLHQLHHVTETPAESAAVALGAGLDVELPMGECYPQLADALDRGLVDAATLDESVRRVLRLKFALGVFERPFADLDAIELDRPAERALAREVAERSIVLLANDGVLPLAAGALRVAVIGPNADDPMALFGNYSFQNHVASHFPDVPQERAPTVLEALRERLGAANVAHAEGCRILAAKGQISEDRSGIAAAAGIASAADVAIVVVGDKAGHFRTGTVGEGTDADSLALPGVQGELVDAVLATGRPTVVVLVNGRPFDLSRIAGRAAAIVLAWFPGQDGGAAIADVLTGAVNPSGKTSLTFARGAGAMPRSYDAKELTRGVPRLPAFEPVFPFGHGLSYTRFVYTDLAIAPASIETHGTLEIACTLRNEGTRAGAEVVQLYLRDPVASITRPLRQLRGFARVALEPGAAARITFSVAADLCSFTGADFVRIVEPGRIDVEISASSEDVRLRGSFELAGKERRVGEDRALAPRVTVAMLDHA